MISHLAPVVRKVDSAFHWMNYYPLDSAIGVRNTYPLDSDLSGGQRYPTFEQQGPDQKDFHKMTVREMALSLEPYLTCF